MHNICSFYAWKLSNYFEIILYAVRFLLFQKLCQHILCIPKYWTLDITKQWAHKGNWNYKLPEDKYWIKAINISTCNITMVIEIVLAIYIPSPDVGLLSVWWALTRKGNNCEKHCKVFVCIDRLLFDVSNNATQMNSKQANFFSIFYNVYDTCN